MRRYGLAILLLLSGTSILLTGEARAQADLLGDLKTDEPAAAPTPAETTPDLDERTEGEPAAVLPPEEIEAVVPGETPTKPAAAATEQPAEIQDRIKAVPRKAVLKQKRFELAAFFTLSLNDAFWQHLATSGSVIFYPHDSFAVGAGVDWIYAHVATSNLDVVRQSLTAVPPLPGLPMQSTWLLTHVDLYWIPIHGKLSLFNRSIVHFDLYGTAGIGFATAFGERQPVVINAGVGQRLFVSDWLAIRLEVRDHLFNDNLDVNGQARSDVQNYVMMQLGASFFIPPTFEYSYR